MHLVVAKTAEVTARKLGWMRVGRANLRFMTSNRYLNAQEWAKPCPSAALPWGVTWNWCAEE